MDGPHNFFSKLTILYCTYAPFKLAYLGEKKEVLFYSVTICILLAYFWVWL